MLKQILFILKFIPLLILTWYFTACSEAEMNSKPVINIVKSFDGLELILSGSIVDSDGTIRDLGIQWGDNSANYFTSIDYSKIEERHLYKEPGNYSITLTATDNLGESTVFVQAVVAGFKETSLANIRAGMFKTSPDEYLMLSINMHTYQELRQNEKFVILTDVIGKMDIDFVAMQECAQLKTSAISSGIIRTDNMALIVAAQLKQKYNADYNFTWHWAHYGWDVWEEGVAVFSKHLAKSTDQRYVSTNASTTNIASRKAIYASYALNGEVFNIFSAHTYWRLSETDQEQNLQIGNIKIMAGEKELADAPGVTLICGDFNGNPTDAAPWSEGYNTMVQNGNYSDTFLAANPTANNKPALSEFFTVGGTFPGRIDYIFMKAGSKYKVIDSQIIFTPETGGVISDHFGVLTKIRKI